MSLNDVYKQNLNAVYERHSTGEDIVVVAVKQYPNLISGLEIERPDAQLLQLAARETKRTRGIDIMFSAISNLRFGAGGDWNIGDILTVADFRNGQTGPAERWSLLSILKSPDNNLWRLYLIWAD
jgi:hypothetical protein